MPVPQSIDFMLYRNDPMAPMILFAPEKYDAHEHAWSVSVEADALEQNLKNFDVAGQDQPAERVRRRAAGACCATVLAPQRRGHHT